MKLSESGLEDKFSSRDNFLCPLETEYFDLGTTEPEFTGKVMVIPFAIKDSTAGEVFEKTPHVLMTCPLPPLQFDDFTLRTLAAPTGGWRTMTPDTVKHMVNEGKLELLEAEELAFSRGTRTRSRQMRGEYNLGEWVSSFSVDIDTEFERHVQSLMKEDEEEALAYIEKSGVEHPLRTALREAGEETGIMRDSVKAVFDFGVKHIPTRRGGEIPIHVFALEIKDDTHYAAEDSLWVASLTPQQIRYGSTLGRNMMGEGHSEQEQDEHNFVRVRYGDFFEKEIFGALEGHYQTEKGIIFNAGDMKPIELEDWGKEMLKRLADVKKMSVSTNIAAVGEDTNRTLRRMIEEAEHRNPKRLSHQEYYGAYR